MGEIERRPHEGAPDNTPGQLRALQVGWQRMRDPQIVALHYRLITDPASFEFEEAPPRRAGHR